MPLNAVVHSRAALAVAQAAILEQLAQWPQAALCCDGRGQLGMIPIYAMPAARLAAGQWNKGWRSGWRYYWTHPDAPEGMTVEVMRVGNRGARLISLSIGPAACDLAATLVGLADEYARDKRRYRPRILRLPWIAMEAIWLNTDSLRVVDRFSSRLDAREGEDFRREAVARARAFLASPRP